MLQQRFQQSFCEMAESQPFIMHQAAGILEKNGLCDLASSLLPLVEDFEPSHNRCPRADFNVKKWIACKAYQPIGMLEINRLKHRPISICSSKGKILYSCHAASCH